MADFDNIGLIETVLAIVTLAVLVTLPLRRRISRRPAEIPDVRLFKPAPDGLHFWTLEQKSRQSFVIRWGVVGEIGETLRLPLSRRGEVLELISECRAEGYAPVADEDCFGLSVCYDYPDAEEHDLIDARTRLAAWLDDALRQRGLGRVDGGNVEPPSMEVLAVVVDPDIADGALPDCLAGSGFESFSRLIFHEPQSASEAYLRAVRSRETKRNAG